MSKNDPFADRVRVRSCGIILVDDKILLVHQQVPTRRQPIWLPPGGGVNFGEPAREALEREFKEETDLEVTAHDLLALHEFIEPPYHAVELYFRAEIVSGTPRTGSDPELDADDQQILACEFKSIEYLTEINLYPKFLTSEFLSPNSMASGTKYFKTEKRDH